jgi:hypothetical protein
LSHRVGKRGALGKKRCFDRREILNTIFLFDLERHGFFVIPAQDEPAI